MSRWWMGEPLAPDADWDTARPVRHPNGSTVTDLVGALNAQLDKILPPADKPRANDPPCGTGSVPAAPINIAGRVAYLMANQIKWS